MKIAMNRSENTRKFAFMIHEKTHYSTGKSVIEAYSTLCNQYPDEALNGQIYLTHEVIQEDEICFHSP